MATCDGGGGEKLADVFDKIWSTYEQLENTSESGNSDVVQVNEAEFVYIEDSSDIPD
jgi:hypothetical protein